ncbi:MAG: hypothetical protein ACI82I_003592, partial [Gammaproteobacteria bacterium]
PRWTKPYSGKLTGGGLGIAESYQIRTCFP